MEMIPSFLISFKITSPAGAHARPQECRNEYTVVPTQEDLTFNERERDGNANYCTISATNVTRGTFVKCHQELRGGSQEGLPGEGDINCSPLVPST